MPNPDQLSLLAEINARMDKLLTLTGAPPPPPAPAGISTEAEQVLSRTKLGDIETALLAIKDGEFRMYSDPNDNDRHVILSLDMTNPASPTPVYLYADNGLPYGGSVNDLENITSTVQTSLETLLTEIRDLHTAREPFHYFVFDSKVTFPATVQGNFQIEYCINGVNTVFDDGGALETATSGTPYTNIATLVTGLNSVQTHFEFYELGQTELDRICIDNSIIGVRTKDRLIPDQYTNNIVLDLDGVIAESDLLVLLPDTSAVDKNIRKLEEIKGLISTTNFLITALTNTFLPKSDYASIPLTSPTSGVFPGYVGAGTLINSIEFVFEGTIDNEKVTFNTDERPLMKYYYDLVNVINEHMVSLIALSTTTESLGISLKVKDGTKLMSNLETVIINFAGSDVTWTRFGDTFSISFIPKTNTLDYILETLDEISNHNKDNESFLNKVAKGNVPGHSLVGVRGRNPDVDTGDAESNIWCVKGQTIVYPTNNVALELLSDDAADTIAGTGAQTVEVTILKTNGDIVKETVNTNGVTPVALANTGFRVIDILVLTAGSGGRNAGNVLIRTTVGTNIQDCIAIGYNRSASSNYTIPGGKTGFLVEYAVRVNRDNNNLNDVKIEFEARENGGLFYNVDALLLGGNGNNQVDSERGWGKSGLSSLTDIQAIIKSVGSSDVDIHFNYTLLLVDNELVNKYLN